MKFNPKIFSNENSKNNLSEEKMKEEEETFELRLSSIDPNCPLNIKSSLKYKENKEGLQTLLFCVFVIVVAMFIILGGYRVTHGLIQDSGNAKKYCLISLQIVTTFDFGFMINFLMKGGPLFNFFI